MAATAETLEMSVPTATEQAQAARIVNMRSRVPPRSPPRKFAALRASAVNTRPPCCSNQHRGYSARRRALLLQHGATTEMPSALSAMQSEGPHQREIQMH